MNDTKLIPAINIGKASKIGYYLDVLSSLEHQET
jgi:hypothetical protein